MINLEDNKNITCPQAGNILNHYKGYFDSVYIILNPFFYLNSIKDDRLNFDDFPDKSEILEKCNPISWREIKNKLGIDDNLDLDFALRNYFQKKEHSNPEMKVAKNLRRLLDEERIMPPEAGETSSFVEDKSLRTFHKLGYKKLYISDEFVTEQKLYDTKCLFDNDLIHVSGSLYPEDHKFLLTTNWENHCSYLCSSRSFIDEVLTMTDLEGFYAKDETEVWKEFETIKPKT